MIKITEKEPNGPNSINSALKYIRSVKYKADDARPLWEMITPELKQSLAYEFSESNPNRWKPISQEWRNHKQKVGRPVTTGIYTGGLKSSLTDQAKIQSNSRYLVYSANTDVVNADGIKVGEYIDRFYKKRPFFKATRTFFNSVIRGTIEAWKQGVVSK